MHRLSSLLVTLSLLAPQSVSAWYADDFIQVQQDTEKRSEVQREEQRARVRIRENRPTELQSRLNQKKPTVQEKKVSQRQRRKETEIWKSESAPQRRLRDRLNRRASVRTSTAVEKLRADILLAVNREREKVGVPPLKRNLMLQTSAQAYAADMKNRNFFSHESPEGETYRERIQRSGYGTITSENCECRSFSLAFGENLARGQLTAEDVMDDWMASPGHRANILTEHFIDIGIGIEGSHWVQHFGTMETVRK